MIVTEIEALTKTRYNIYIDEVFAFVLYKGELSKYQVRKEHEITEETISRIKDEVLIKRAKLRAMHLLNAMPRTEHQLREKLVQNGYPEDVTDTAISYVKSFGYINDEAYIRNFVINKRANKSKREIKMLLGQKGVKGEQVDFILEELYQEESEADTIRRIMEKKHWELSEMDEKQRQKMYGYLMRKGFSYEEIRKALAKA